MGNKIKELVVISAALGLLSSNAMALIDVTLTPNTPWDVGSGGYVAEGIKNTTPYTVQNTGEAVRFNIRGTSSQDWNLGEAPGLDTFAIRWAGALGVTEEEWFPVRTFDKVLNDNSASLDFYLRYYPPRYLSKSVGEQVSKVVLSAVSSFIGAWTSEEPLDLSGSAGMAPTIVVGANGDFHVLYGDQIMGLKYAKWSGAGAFSFQNIVGGGGSGNSMVLGSDGKPYVIYSDKTSGEGVMLIGLDEQKVETRLGFNGSYFSLAMDKDNNIHVAADSGGEILYSKYNGSSWSAPQVIDSGGRPAIQVDSNNAPHIVYTNYGLKYARWNRTSNAWDVPVQLSHTDNTGENVMMRVDSKDNLHIVYMDYPTSSIGYGRYDGGKWEFQQLGNGENPNISLFENGYPSVAYLTQDGVLVCKRWTGTEWLESAVDPSGTEDRPGIVVDLQGRPHLFYRNNGLKHSSWQ